MATEKVLVQVNGVTFEQAKIVREKKTVGFGNMPVVPETVKAEDDYAVWLNDMVEKGVFTYKQVVEQGLYNIYLKMSAKIGFEYANANVTEMPKKLSLADMTAAMAFREEAIETCGPKANNPELVTDTMFRLWHQSKRTASGDWDASKHVLFPKDVR